MDSWGYNGTSSITNNGTITIDASLSDSATANAITATSKDNNIIIHNGTITMNGGNATTNTGINAYSQSGVVFVQTAKDSLIDIKAPTDSVNHGIKVSGNSSLDIAGDISIAGNSNSNYLAGTNNGILSEAGSSTINHSGNITLSGSGPAAGISVQSTNAGDTAHIESSSGNISVSGYDFVAGIYTNVDSTASVIYDNAQGIINAGSTSSSNTGTAYGTASGIFNKSISGDATTVITNAFMISGGGGPAFAIQNISSQGNSYVVVANANSISASGDAATAISSKVEGGVGNSQIDLTNIDRIDVNTVGDNFAIVSQNAGAGDSIINIGGGVNSIYTATLGITGTKIAVYSSANEGDSIINSAAQHIYSKMPVGHSGIFSESASGNSQITTSSHVDMHGENAFAISAKTSSGTNKVTLASGADIQGGYGDALLASGVIMQSGSGEQELNISSGASLTSLNDSALYSTNASGKTTVNNGGQITGYANLTGNDVTFNNQSSGVIDLKNFGPDQWNKLKDDITYNVGSSNGTFNNAGLIKFADENFDGTASNAVFNVTTFTNSGTIDLTGKNPTSANDLVGDTFTINGNYVSNGGSIYLNTLLDDASSNGGQGTSDLIVVNGNVTTGTSATKLYITPTASTADLGGLTSGDGIKVIDVQGTSTSNAFQLGRPVAAGAYEYTLRQGQSDDSWYLSSYNKNNTGANTTIQYNPAMGAYFANQTAAIKMFQQTLFDRLISSSDGKTNDASKNLFWMRTKMTHGSYDSIHNGLSNRTRSYTLQMGGDLNVWALNNSGYFHLGVMGGYGDFKDTSKSDTTGTKAEGKVKGYTAGVYGTYFDNQDTNLGLYLDLWSQMGWYRNEISGEAQIGTKKYNSTVWSNSVEVGYGIPLAVSGEYQWLATPQAQLAYNSYDVDNQHDKNNLNITNNNANGLDTRLGIRFHARGVQKDLIEPFLEVNWLDTTAKNKLNFNGKSYKDGFAKDRFEAKVGLQGNINKQWSVSAQVGGQWGNNSYNNYQGQLNINYKF